MKVKSLVALLVFGALLPSCTQDVGAPNSEAVPAVQPVLAADRGLGLGNGNTRTPGLVSCAPHAYDATTVVIGPAGGQVRVGKHVLRIPAGALDSATPITMAISAAPVVAVTLSPHGLTFHEPAELELNYAACGNPNDSSYRVAYTDDQYQILEYVPSLDQHAAHKVVGRLRHFSKYAVAY